MGKNGLAQRFLSQFFPITLSLSFSAAICGEKAVVVYLKLQFPLSSHYIPFPIYVEDRERESWNEIGTTGEGGCGEERMCGKTRPFFSDDCCTTLDTCQIQHHTCDKEKKMSLSPELWYTYHFIYLCY